MAGLKPKYTDYDWGWTDIRGAQIVAQHGSYLVKLPPPISLHLLLVLRSVALLFENPFGEVCPLYVIGFMELNANSNFLLSNSKHPFPVFGKTDSGRFFDWLVPASVAFG